MPAVSRPDEGKGRAPVRYLRGSFVYGRTFVHDGDLDQQRQYWLEQRYTAQSPTVRNRGRGGEELSAGVQRLPSVLNVDRPRGLLLMDGTNDVVQGD